MKYLVYLEFTFSIQEEVEADSAEEAEDRARWKQRGRISFNRMDLSIPRVEEIIDES